MLHGFAVPLLVFIDSVLGIERVELESVYNMRFQHNKVRVVHAEDMRCALRLLDPREATVHLLMRQWQM